MSNPKFITFASNNHGGWDVVNKQRGDYLGLVVWYDRWKRFMFQPRMETEYDAVCLRDIAVFLDEQTADRKARR